MDRVIQREIDGAHYTIDASHEGYVYIYINGKVTENLLTTYTTELITLMDDVVGPNTLFPPLLADVQQAEAGILADATDEDVRSLFSERTKQVFAIVDPQSAQLQGTIPLVKLLTGAQGNVTVVTTLDDAIAMLNL